MSLAHEAFEAVVDPHGRSHPTPRGACTAESFLTAAGARKASLTCPGLRGENYTHLYYVAVWRDQEHCHPSEHEKLLEYLYDGCPLDPNVYSGQKIDTPDDSQGHTPHWDLQLSDAGLKMANQMLTLARQSYHSPKGKEGYRTRNIIGLPNVTIFNEDLLNKCFTGVLKVRLHCANNMRRLGLLRGYARPYVEAFVAASSFRTEYPTRGSLSDPDWDEDHWMYIRDAKYDSLSIRVLGDTRFVEGVNLGAAVLGLQGLVEKEGQEMHFKLPLRGFAGENSTISITCCFHKLPSPDSDPKTSEELVRELQKYQTRNKGTPNNEAAQVKDMGIRVGGSSSVGGSLSQQQELLPVAYVDCGSTETQAWVFSSTAQRKVVIAFRGTEPRLADIITDARFMPCAFETIIQGHSNDEVTARRQRVRVHRGFMHAYKSVRRTLSSIVFAITGPDQGVQHTWDIHFTGHSLGGALATLGAYELGIYRDYAGNIGSVSLHTYGSPRVGGREFVTEFDKMVPNAWRFTNRADIVPTVPPSGLCNYHHVGHPVRLRGNGEVLRGLNSWEEEEEREKQQKLGETAKGPSEILRDNIQRDTNVLLSILRRGIRDHSGVCYDNNLPKRNALLQQQA